MLFLVTDAYGATGGIAKVNRDLLGALNSSEHVDRIMVLPRLQADRVGTIPRKIDYRASASKGRLSYVTALFSAVARDRSFGTVICGHLHLLPLALAAARLCGARLLLVVHGIEAWEPSRHSLANQLVRAVDLAVAVSDVSRRRFCGWSGFPVGKTTVVPNSVDLTHFSPGPRRTDLVDRYGLQGRRVVLTLGRLAGEARAKGFDRVLDVLPSLAEEMPDVVYLIAGDGPDRARLEDKAQCLGVSDRVVFTGFVNEDEKADHYRLADAFAMPSHGEGFGIALVEAMACGVAAVASCADGSQEAVLGGALGAVVDPDDLGALQRALIRAVSSPNHVPAGLDTFSEEAFRARWHIALMSVPAVEYQKVTALA